MKKIYLFVLICFLFACAHLPAQDLHTNIQDMISAYAASGSIVALDDHNLLIEPNMPGPLCALPKNEGGRTTWAFYSFPLASINLPLASVDETLIGQDTVFTDPDAPKTYKPGDQGDTVMVVIVTVPGKRFHTLTYDREKLARLGPGPHNASAYGQAPDDTEAFGLTFTDRTAARLFMMALRDAVLQAKAQPIASVKPASR